jgi:hypothetical protein
MVFESLLDLVSYDTILLPWLNDARQQGQVLQ